MVYVGIFFITLAVIVKIKHMTSDVEVIMVSEKGTCRIIKKFIWYKRLMTGNYQLRRSFLCWRAVIQLKSTVSNEWMDVGWGAKQ